MKNRFEFRAVGQGLFYTGSLNDGKYTFVYDCGTESNQKYIQREINEFAPFNRNNQKKIDFVVVSHLHKDHFSGLFQLMNNANVQKVFLPYLGRSNTNLTRLIIAHAVLADESSFEYDERNLGLYNQITALYENREHNYPNTEVEFLGEESKQTDSSPFTFSRRTFNAFQESEPFWKFVFINKRINNNDLSKLENEVSIALSILGINSIEECLRTESGIKKIQLAYEKVFGKGNELNLTSTLLVHYPVTANHITFIWQDSDPLLSNKPPECFYCPDPVQRFCYRYKKGERIATVLTGDAELDDTMRQHVRNEIKGVCAGILQIPHHGSKANWDSLNDLQSVFLYYVISFGLGNKHKHPNSKVIDDIDNIVQKNESQRLYLTTQSQSLIYTIHI